MVSRAALAEEELNTETQRHGLEIYLNKPCLCVSVFKFINYLPPLVTGSTSMRAS